MLLNQALGVRELFSALALQGVLANPHYMGLDPDKRADIAVRCTDALIARLGRVPAALPSVACLDNGD